MATATGTPRTAPVRRTEGLRLPRTTGALSGFLIVLLGIWGGLIPFIGPYFHYAFGGYQTWHFTSQRLWLNIVPGAVAVIGGLMLIRASTRVGGLTAGWMALAAGAWFAVGPAVSVIWHHTIYAIGVPAGGNTRRTLEWVGYFYGLGAVIVALAAFAMGRYFSRPRVIEEVPLMAEEAVAAHAPVGRAAVADAPVERAGVVDAPVERAGVVDAPVERAGVADAPVERAGVADARMERAGVTDAPTERAAGTDATAQREPVADAPATAAPTAAPTSRRRSGGVLRRFRS